MILHRRSPLEIEFRAVRSLHNSSSLTDQRTIVVNNIIVRKISIIRPPGPD